MQPISNVDTARIRYGYFSTKNEIATLAMKNVNSTLYVGLPVDTMPKPNKLNKAKNWVFGLKLIPHLLKQVVFQSQLLKASKSLGRLSLINMQGQLLALNLQIPINYNFLLVATSLLKQNSLSPG